MPLGVLKKRFEPGMLAHVKHHYNVYNDLTTTFDIHSVTTSIRDELIVINEKAGDFNDFARGSSKGQIAWYKIMTRDAIVGYIMLPSYYFDEDYEWSVYV